MRIIEGIKNKKKLNLSTSDYELAFLVAAEFVVNPPKTKEEMQMRLEQQPVENPIKFAACHLLVEWAKSAIV